jgi:hypothetical protein
VHARLFSYRSRLNLSLGGKPQNLAKKLCHRDRQSCHSVQGHWFYRHSLRTGPSGEWYFCITPMTCRIKSRRPQDPRSDHGINVFPRNQASSRTVTKLISVFREETKHCVCDFSFGNSRLCSSLIVRKTEESLGYHDKFVPAL